MKIFVIYRDNALFRQHVPQLLTGLDVAETFIVPQGQQLDAVLDAATAAAERAQTAGATTVLTDSTCYRATQVKTAFDTWPRCRFNKAAVLDTLFKGQILKQRPQSTVADNFIWFAKQVVGDRVIKTAIVVKSRISDHGFVGNDGGEKWMEPDERVVWVIKQLAAMLIHDAAINVVGTLEEALKYAEDPETLIVLDRHCGIKEIMSKGDGWYGNINNWTHPSALYMLPFETCATNLTSRGNLDFTFDIEAMRKEILEVQ